MGNRVLLYGATGFSGRLIAAEMALRWRRARPDIQIVLAARGERALTELADELELPCLVLALDTRAEVVRALSGFHLVVNAAGPFALTAERLAKAALDAGCHYVDINGEADVYGRLDDLSDIADRRSLALVCGAGETAAATDVLLEVALRDIDVRAGGQAQRRSLGAVRFAIRRARYFSRGSAQTAVRSMREQVPVVRAGASVAGGGLRRMHVCHLPGGQLERSFDYGGAMGRRIGVAVAMIDTLMARSTLKRLAFDADTIETYMEMPTNLRWLHQAGSWSAGWLGLPLPRRFLSASTALLPDGPDEQERADNRHTVLLEVDDAFRRPLARWRLETPDPYEFTARSAVAVCEPLLRPQVPTGWVTPSQLILGGAAAPASAIFDPRRPTYPFVDCRLEQRPCP